MQFECKVEENSQFQPFLDELKSKFDTLDKFRKSFQKWQVGLDSMLKKVGVFDKHVQLHMHANFMSYIWLICNICSKIEDFFFGCKAY